MVETWLLRNIRRAILSKRKLILACLFLTLGIFLILAVDVGITKRPPRSTAVEISTVFNRDAHFDVDVALLAPALRRRYVHLDLKGGTPKMEYLIGLVPFLKQWGATGILLEYEDMFPFEGILSVVAAPNAYTKSSLKDLIDVIKNNDMDIIPLIQTAGHMEYILKHKSFAHIREYSNYPAFLNMGMNESIYLVKQLIDQIIDFHGDLQYLHIGADEVYILGISKESKAMNGTKDYLYLSHVKTVAAYVKENHPQVTVLMWDDMLRHMPMHVLQESELSTLVTPVIWAYKQNVFERITPYVFKKYSKVFTSIYVASAFKGATGPTQYLPVLTSHIRNHVNWLQTLTYVAKKYPTLSVEGFFLAGWSRYDHFAALCDLLPTALPSLALCLSVITKCSWDSEIFISASKALTSDENGDRNVFLVDEANMEYDYSAPNQTIPYNFPGHGFFTLMLEYNQIMNNYSRHFDSVAGTSLGHCNGFSLGHRYIDPYQTQITCLRKIKRLTQQFDTILKKFTHAFGEIFDNAVAAEWLDEHVLMYKQSLKKLRRVIEEATYHAQWGYRPSKHVPADKLC